TLDAFSRSRPVDKKYALLPSLGANRCPIHIRRILRCVDRGVENNIRHIDNINLKLIPVSALNIQDRVMLLQMIPNIYTRARTRPSHNPPLIVSVNKHQSVEPHLSMHLGQRNRGSVLRMSLSTFKMTPIVSNFCPSSIGEPDLQTLASTTLQLNWKNRKNLEKPKPHTDGLKILNPTRRYIELYVGSSFGGRMNYHLKEMIEDDYLFDFIYNWEVVPTHLIDKTHLLYFTMQDRSKIESAVELLARPVELQALHVDHGQGPARNQAHIYIEACFEPS
ncbi:mediator of RNA polymerase II transcription subunit, partial [Striga asiatica]